jgi:hypothetical protein
MASFHLELTDQRGSHFHGPFAGVTVIGANAELCQLTLPGHLPLENRHAELRPTQVPYQLMLSPCTTASRVYLWRQGRPWLLAQPCVIQHGERFSLLTPDGPTFRLLAMAEAAAPAPQQRRAQWRPGKKTVGAISCMGTLIGLVVIGLIAKWVAGPDAVSTWWSRERTVKTIKKKPERFEPIMERTYVKNSRGDPTKEMDRWTQISGNNNYRSARIHSFDQLRMIKERYGITTVLNLAMDSMSKQKDLARNCGGLQRPCEPRWAKELDLIYRKVYLGAKPPREEDWEMIQELLKAGDTLVHCTHGVDRTGAVVGKWQHVVDPDLTEGEILDYTYSFGGQWRLGSDPNRFLRDWMLADIDR